MLMRCELTDQLLINAKSDMYPMHMPGHKRNLPWDNPVADVSALDVTEVEGFDDLHHPEGILRRLQERAARLFGVEESRILVNGSTAGILAAISAVCRAGDEILVSRNAHRSVWHAFMLRNLKPIIADPEVIDSAVIHDAGERGRLCGGVSADQVRQILAEHPQCRAALITSPSYEGILPDVPAIAEIIHERQGILIVDEAHGAHLHIGSRTGYFPLSAVDSGADVVVQSLHKTLPALTQTALLHIGSGRVDERRIDQWLDVYQSSSPSYVLMSSIEQCIAYMEEAGDQAMTVYAGHLREWMEWAKTLKHIHVMGNEVLGQAGVWARDPSKLVIFPPAGVSGKKLAEALRLRFHIETEMSCRSYVLAMTSVMDSNEGFERLRKALEILDREYDGSAQCEGCERDTADCHIGTSSVMEASAAQRTMTASAVFRQHRAALPMSEAMDAQKDALPGAVCAGRTSAGFVSVYPPGIPIIMPGEVIVPEDVEEIQEALALGLEVTGILTDDAYVRPDGRHKGKDSGCRTAWRMEVCRE